jgi:ABC-type dipeptide/oligopeptide/nickel transport system ATPase component
MGCRFHPRCASALDICSGAVPVLELKTSGFAACHASSPVVSKGTAHV